MPSHGHWSSGHHEPPGSSGSASSVNRYDLNLPYAMSFSDEYEDSADLADTNPGERLVRRRSSKACDQCRKSKCKCERASPNESCRNCVMLGTQCTFLGPSRKRGPPKGYIDAIEARLHQMEALIGIMLLSGDDRATTLLEDISQDPLAKAIINRVDNSPYGVKGRGRESGKGKHAQPKDDQATNELASTHPSNEWQDTVTAMLRKAVVARGGKLDTPRLPTMNISDDEPGPSAQNRQHREDLPAIVTASSSARDSSVTDHEDVDSTSPGRRQRRRIDDGSYDSVSEQSESQTSAAPASMISPTVPPDSSRLSHSPTTRSFASPVLRSVSQQSAPALSPLPRVVRRNTASSQTSGKEPPTGASSDGYASEDEDELPGALGQLSLNEEEQVRYHGKASGLYLLGTKDRIDQRNEGGIWRFPKARVWPPLPSKSVAVQNGDEPDFTGRLPPPEVQEQLVDLYFTYVHPVLPILYKRAFLENFRAFSNSSRATSPQAVGSDRSSSTPGSPLVNRHRLVSPLLLFAMFAVAARYSNSPSVLPLGSGATPPMWDAGDEYLEQAQRILDRSYASSKPETCQALLLMGYREIGIGAMAQAWTYVGMAIRMAQDLGMHRRADGWARAGFGRLFGDWELQERRRIWFACVVMDKYVSSYIGRPLMIFERDFDTLLPNEDDAEEFDDWIPHVAGQSQVPSVPGKIITCFNAAAVLSGILSMIVQAIYAVRPVCSRHGESVFLEGILDKWYHELPEHLQYEPSSSKRVPLPHILTLHMQYWCAVLLLHRPFIRNMYQARIKSSPERNEDGDARAQAEKNYELSAGAANHITTIATLYTENYPLKFCPPFLCYYVFTASVMHVTSLTAFPADPQARVGLNKCMEILRVMQIVWPSAGRALELLRGSKVNDQIPVIPTQGKESMDRRKRPLDSHSHELPTVGLGYSEHLPAHHHDNYENTPHYNEHQHNPQHQPGQYISTSSLATDLQSVHSPPPTSYYRTEQRWNPEHHFENVQYAGALTTSVLPQTYSTGLVDDRTMASGQAHRGALHSPSAGHQGSSADHRYPQYWNDYSAYSQLGHNNYTPASEHAPVQATHSSPQVYLHEPYNIYNNQVRDV
ncbi:hypothetical protein VNI00_000299 [Paramarasmius palmivorus]|uniref:Zn(2)-C6 fungal-type domain-containing protein n=1 Tax=Paramarasmius palmivorus TaxID=297713 RepID=A0AAW0EC64_9AGAR